MGPPLVHFLAMLSFDIRSLESTPERVDGDLLPDDPVWEAGDLRPAGPVHVTGRVSSAGSGRFYFSGQIEGAVGLECRRCLTDVEVPVAADLHLIFADAGDEEIEDPDVYSIDPAVPELDLRPAIREEWILSVPAFALCRDDCRGLCPTCGADLNDDPAHSHGAADPRWAALRDLARE
jgi:uncharacterized protein